LILEQATTRIQAFTTRGDPSPTFHCPSRFSVTSGLDAIFAELTDASKIFGTLLRALFQQRSIALKKKWNIFSLGDYYVLQATSDSDANPQIDVWLDGDNLFTLSSAVSNWTELLDNAGTVIPDQLKSEFQAHDYSLSSAATLDNRIHLTDLQTNQTWQVWDLENANSYKLIGTFDENQKMTNLEVIDFLPTFPLQAQSPSTTVTYLDIATESLGYIYVLYYTGDGSSVDNYCLDLYSPIGAFLSHTPNTERYPDARGINAAKIIVDRWRNIYGMNFDILLGPNGRTEPTVSVYIPTTPSTNIS